MPGGGTGEGAKQKKKNKKKQKNRNEKQNINTGTVAPLNLCNEKNHVQRLMKTIQEYNIGQNSKFKQLKSYNIHNIIDSLSYKLYAFIRENE